MREEQLTIPELIPGSYWVEVVSHGIIPAGTRYLIVDDYLDCWLVGYKNGVKPIGLGTLLHKDSVRKVEPCDTTIQ